MKQLIMGLTVLCGFIYYCGAANVEMPLEEFKSMYKEQLLSRQKEDDHKKKPPERTILRECRYEIELNGNLANANVTLTGELIGEKPPPLLLFDSSVLIERIGKMEGAKVFQDGDDVWLSPVLGKRLKDEFTLCFELVFPVLEDEKSFYSHLVLPPGLIRMIEVALPKNWKVEASENLFETNDNAYLCSSRNVTLRFSPPKRASETTELLVDSFSVIHTREDGLLISSRFVVESAVNEISINLPQKAKVLSSTLNRSWYELKKGNVMRVRLPNGYEKAFKINMMIAGSSERTEEFVFKLPFIEKNIGFENCFCLFDSNKTDLKVGNKNCSIVPIENLNPKLKVRDDDLSGCRVLPKNDPLKIQISRLRSINMPKAVLEQVRFQISYDENGGAFTVISFDMPKNEGERVMINPIPQAKLWYLKINGRKSDIYLSNDGKWVVPLDKNKVNHVDIAYLIDSPKLGVAGQLSVHLPAIGLPAKKVNVVVDLPKRLDMVSLDGPLNPLKTGTWNLPEPLSGRPYYFQRSFYNGEATNASIYYKEPVMVK